VGTISSERLAYINAIVDKAMKYGDAANAIIKDVLLDRESVLLLKGILMGWLTGLESAPWYNTASNQRIQEILQELKFYRC
jgi:hypothetical protein